MTTSINRYNEFYFKDWVLLYGYDETSAIYRIRIKDSSDPLYAELEQWCKNTFGDNGPPQEMLDNPPLSPHGCSFYQEWHISVTEEKVVSSAVYEFGGTGNYPTTRTDYFMELTLNSATAIVAFKLTFLNR